jgi:hypothetical protein
VISDGRELSAGQRYRTLVAVSEAIVSHRDLATLFDDLAGALYLVVRFDYLACVLHDATSKTMRLHVLKVTKPNPAQPPSPFFGRGASCGNHHADQQTLRVYALGFPQREGTDAGGDDRPLDGCAGGAGPGHSDSNH